MADNDKKRSANAPGYEHLQHEFIKNAQRESDRGLALLVGAIVETHLEDILRNALRKVPKHRTHDLHKRVFEFNGPLGTCIHALERFVHEIDAGVLHEGSRQENPLLLTTG